MKFTGEFAAIFTSFCWTLSAIGFSRATLALGSQVTNRVRVTLASLVLIGINLVLYGWLVPLQASGERWLLLSISGIIGLSIGDTCLFIAYKHIGPRLGLLLLSMAPIFSASLAWVTLHETLNFIQIAGILVTLGGISYVVLKRPGELNLSNHNLGKGILFSMLAALTQAVGMIISRQGMANNFPPFAGSLIRMLAASAALWIMAVLQGEVRSSLEAVRSRPDGLQWASFGALFGPVLGVSASLLAIQHTEIGVASTLIALPPVFMLPVSHFIIKEKMNWQSIAGTLVAIGGVALLFLG